MASTNIFFVDILIISAFLVFFRNHKKISTRYTNRSLLLHLLPILFAEVRPIKLLFGLYCPKTANSWPRPLVVAPDCSWHFCRCSCHGCGIFYDANRTICTFISQTRLARLTPANSVIYVQQLWVVGGGWCGVWCCSMHLHKTNVS